MGARPGPSGSCGTFDRVGVFRNADGAGSWTEAYAGLAEGSGREAASVAVDPRNPRIV